MASLPRRPEVLVEPFAGGASVSLMAADESRVDHVVMSELDPMVASLWREVLTGDSEALDRRVEMFDLTEPSVRELLLSVPDTDADRAFLTLVKNRVSRGGVMTKHAGIMRAGERGKGMASRWYPETLAARLRLVASLSDRVTFLECDGLDLVRSYQHDPGAAFFVDPP